jgi:NADH:ubiquinone oxidoreductase subunit 3 (subunit A)
MFIIASILILLMSASFLLSNYGGNSTARLSGYECGLEPIADAASTKLKIVYYVIGLLYLLFDLEIIFLYPLATSLWLINNFLSLSIILIFILLLTFTFIYEWFIGALELM